MPDSITYGSYSFPEPLPLFAEEDQSVNLGGLYDHSAINVNLIGYFTGSDLSGLDLQKMQMISGFLNEYEDLTITVGNESKTCPKAFVQNIDFGESDSTTFQPYSLTVAYYSGETFSEYFRVTQPENNWSYAESENKVITATHKVSAKGLKVDEDSAFENAKNFVSQKLVGFENISLFNGTGNAFLQSRSEDIDSAEGSYGITEVYIYSSSDRPISDKGILDVSTSISYNSEQELSLSVQGSLQGRIDANTGVQEGLLSTGDFSAEQATDIATNALVNSHSEYESGVYNFVSRGPTSFNYDLNTGSNLLNFSFSFEDAENLDLINGNVLHKYSSSVSVTKDSSIANISVNGDLSYRGTSIIYRASDESLNERFLAVESAYSEVDQYSIAKSSFQEFTGVATGYEFLSSYIDPEPQNFSVTKDPIENTLSYSYTYSNSIDFSNGALNNLKLTIKDKKPLVVVNVQETIGGSRAAEVISRSLGEYSVSATANNQGEDLGTLKDIVSGYCSGKFYQSESYDTGQNSISYNLQKYY
jgi:hypothetical protein